ncbi:unnamed protein product [Urochloa decumbens]|uniref:Uncharacterized protein n=1 Tax=Urochloa decumbens TaxID=240449 RepID=A0ABC9EX00_9POAL
MQGPPKKKKKKANEESTKNDHVLATSGPTPMHFPPKSICGSSQPNALSIEYHLLISNETTPPALSQPIGKRNRKGKAVEVKAKAKKTKGATTTKKTKGATTTKKKQQPLLPVTPQSHAMCTRSKTLENPAMSTRSLKKIRLNVKLLPSYFATYVM